MSTTFAEITGAQNQFFTVLFREKPLENIGVGGEAVPASSVIAKSYNQPQ